MNLSSDVPVVPVPPSAEGDVLALPAGWSAFTPQSADTADLHALLCRHQAAARGWASAASPDVEVEVAGLGAETRRHVLVRDASGAARGWGTAHDRAAGRVLVSVIVDPELDARAADGLAGQLFAWAADGARGLAMDRGLDVTQMDSGAFADDPRQQRWLAAAGFTHTRTWLQMTRPVTAADADPRTEPETHADLVVRRVERAGDGMPEEVDLITVHDVLEEAFTDHFNYHAETFEEFLSRLREDPGHRWDHWWIAELTDGPDGPRRPAGALVGAVALGAGDAPAGSYVEYLGVLRAARGRGAAKSLLHAVIADAARRGRDRVGLEVDADSPTGAVDLYTSTGFATSYVTQSWHSDLAVVD